MKISYVTPYDAKDIHQWSGTGLNIAKSLEEQGVEVQYAGSLIRNLSAIDISKRAFYKIIGKKYLFDRVPRVIKDFSRQADLKIEPSADIVFSTGMNPIAYMNVKKPKVFYTDATFAGMIDFYEGFTNMSKETIVGGHLVEQAAIDSCDLAIYSSKWAADSAINDYGADPKKVKIVQFGANVVCDRTFADIKAIASARDTQTCNLLFLGVDWDRKGGAMALAVADLLNKRGLNTNLHITGIKELPLDSLPPFVYNHGFISKTTPEGQKKIDNLLSESHFLILPSKADCTPIVYAEANSFGLPCITTNVGGITSIVEKDINGMTFPLSASADDYCDFIESLFIDYERYLRLCHSSFQQYEENLNWNTTGERLVSLMRQL